MKNIYDEYALEAARKVTRSYSTSFYMGVRFLDPKIRKDIHAVYGFVRVADEIVDSFHGYDQSTLLDEFRQETFLAIERGISTNPILHAFQSTVNKYSIPHELITTFLDSMEMDLKPQSYNQKLYDKYILGSAEVVGLMCLKVFVYGDEDRYLELKPYAMKLGSAFQKINFLRDLKDDFYELGRIYFPGVNMSEFNDEMKRTIEQEIEIEFNEAFQGIKKLPKSSRFGVYVSYVYYRKLLYKIKAKSLADLMEVRIRVPNKMKMFLFFKSYFRNAVNLL